MHRYDISFEFSSVFFSLFSFPTATSSESIDEVVARELQVVAIEKEQILEFESYLAAASKATITERNSLLLPQVWLFFAEAGVLLVHLDHMQLMWDYFSPGNYNGPLRHTKNSADGCTPSTQNFERPTPAWTSVLPESKSRFLG